MELKNPSRHNAAIFADSVPSNVTEKTAKSACHATSSISAAHLASDADRKLSTSSRFAGANFLDEFSDVNFLFHNGWFLPDERKQNVHAKKVVQVRRRLVRAIISFLRVVVLEFDFVVYDAIV